MNALVFRGLDGSDPMGFMAACGLLRVAARTIDDTRLSWVEQGGWLAQLHVPDGVDPSDLVMNDLKRWRKGHPAVDFAVGAERKVQDLKHPPVAYRELMRMVAPDREGAPFIAAYATGVAVDGSGQTKPTSFHFTAGQQRFMDVVLNLRDEVEREDVVEALEGPWVGREGPKNLRWRAASERSRALLSFDPGKAPTRTVGGATWLAYQALPLFPCVPVGLRVATTGFTGRGKNERFSWPIWETPLSVDAVRVLVGTTDIADTDAEWRDVRGVVQVFEAAVVRNSQGYGNFAAANPRAPHRRGTARPAHGFQ